MTSERWKQVEAVFEQALELPAEERAGFVQRSCDGDEELRAEVRSLLRFHLRAGTVIDRPDLFIAGVEIDEGNENVASGQLIGAYRVMRELGRGGMGVVYLAERADKHYEKRVAIKLIKRGMDTDSVLRHFHNERQILASFDHPSIARLFDGGTTENGLPYFVMEYVEGLPIDEYCDTHGLSINERLKLFLEVCTAVTYAHRHTVIHRDIKPSNVLVTNEGVPKLLDFGIAKLLQADGNGATIVTATGLRVMTPQYASPEQLEGRSVTVATDVYSLGMVLYQVLTGRTPYEFKSCSPGDIARAVAETEPKKPSTAIVTSDGTSKSQIPNPKLLRGDLDNIVLMALRKDPARRYQSAEEFSKDVQRYLEGLPVVARKDTLGYRSAKFLRRNPVLAAAATACVMLALAVVWLVRAQLLVPRSPAPEKSIAVLPFENLSRDPDNAFFTSGVQDEVLTALARIADLKVISRTSVMEYRSGIARDLREIGQQLGVAHVLEGSVQRSGNRVRVNAQLVDARTDAHLWAQTYDRDLADVFAIQSDIAKAIANQLRAKFSVTEQTAIAEPPTTDLTAFLLYNRAKFLLLLTTMSTGEAQKFRQAIDLLNQAVARDPSFFLAYCQLAYTHDQLYFLGADHTSARLAMAEAAIQAALRLRPNAGEAHLARAENLYRGHLDYGGALVELGMARRTLPNDPRIFELIGAIQSRQGKYEEGLRNLERALQLDPRNMYTLHHIALRNGLLRRYAEEAAVLDRCLTIDPNDVDTRVARARLDLEWKADSRPLHEFIDAIRTENPGAVPTVADSWFACALAERDARAAESALEALGENAFGNDAVKLSRTFGEGLIARMTKDDPKARTAFIAAHTEQEKRAEAQPNYGPALCILGLIDAGLGRKEDALREGRRAIELMPVEKDFTNGVHMIEYFAIMAAWAGEKDLACEQLAIATRLPGYVSYGQLKLLPYWDPLRGDPRFEKIVASLAPK